MTQILFSLLVWLTSFTATPATDHILLKWQTDASVTNLTGFYLYRQTSYGWEQRTQGYLPKKEISQHYKFKDYVVCGQSYTYLLRAFGQRRNQSYFEDWRLDNIEFPCP